MKTWLSIAASILVLLGGFTTLQVGTDSGKAWTTESARRLDIRKNPKQLVDAQLVTSDNKELSIFDYKKPIVLINFIYTQCPTVCIGLGLEFKQLQSDLSSLGYTNDVQLLSISFDLENDTPEKLDAYLKLYNANRTQWAATVFQTKIDMANILEQLNVIVIPEERLGFVHNTGIYMIHDGKVIEIFNINDREKLFKRLHSILS